MSEKEDLLLKLLEQLRDEFRDEREASRDSRKKLHERVDAPPPPPPLPPPPLAAVDALQAAGDSAVDAWAVALDRHYQKLDACTGK